MAVVVVVELLELEGMGAGVGGCRSDDPLDDGGGCTLGTTVSDAVGTGYGAHFCLRASRRSFFCCIINRRLSSLDLVLEFSSSDAHRAHWAAGPVGVSSGWPHLHWILTGEVGGGDDDDDDAAVKPDAATLCW